MPTKDNANSAKGTAVASVTTSSWAIAGSSRLLLAGMGWADGTPATYSEMRWEGAGGTLLTQVGSTVSGGSFHRCALARLIAPNATSGTLYGAVTAVQGEICVGGISYTGVDQTTPLGTPATNSGTGGPGTTFSSTVDVSSAAGELVSGIGYGGTTAGSVSACTVAVGAGQTLGWEQENINNFSAGTMSDEAGAGTVTISADFTFNLSDTWAWCTAAVGIKNAPPEILTQPTDLAVIFGNSAAFTVEASSATGGALSYQWTQNGANVGTNASSYTTSQTFAADQNARFAVSVWDVNGTTQSQNAYLRLTFSSGAYAQEIADRYSLEDASGVYLIEPWGGGTPATTLGPFFVGPLNGLGAGGRFHKNRLH